MNDYRKYLDPKTVAKVGNLELVARLVVEGFITGLHRSPYHGFSVEFAEHRAYRPGDEIKYLDWKVFARTGKYYVKEFQEETNLRCTIAIDASRSMAYASNGNISKYEYSAYLAAALSLLMIQQRDAIGLTLFDNGIRTFLPPNSKPSYMRQILKTLEQNSPANDTGTASALNLLAEKIRRRGLVIVFSDFFDNPDDILTALKHFRHKKHEVIVFHVLDPREIDFKVGAPANFVDMESGETMLTNPYQIQLAYKNAVNDYINFLKKECLNHQIDYNLLDTSASYDHALSSYLVKRKKM
ncbi:MAG: DUF58 domain-containing protein [Ignavibacteria bacterium]|nr:DUF58 domain-containing protein [Ignavibacteria bacterium]